MLKEEILLNEVEAKDLIRKAGIPVVDTRLACDKNEAVSLSRDIGFPAAMKIISPDIVHKSDVGGVRLGLAGAAEVGKAYDEMMDGVRQKLPAARITGVSIQKMASAGVEVIIGMVKDAQFGPVIMFGLGGIMVEVLKDVSFRIVPLTRWDAAEMISEIKGYAILKGFRGQEPVNITALEDLILKVSEFIAQNPQVKELDLNPVIAYSDSAIAVDARIVIETTP
jgi:acetate---CoA ligase (ADP-forming) subunit beta